MAQKYDAAVVGGGIAGYTAALTLKSLKVNFIWFGALSEKILAAEYVRNFPAFVGSGRELAEKLETQRRHEGIEGVKARIDGIYAVKDGFTLTAGQEQYEAKSVILATGVETAGCIAGEREFLGRGVSCCAVCDGALYKDKPIAAIITSEHFAHEAEYLAGFASEVHVFCSYHNPVFHASNIILHSDMPLRVEGSMRVEEIVTNEGVIPIAGVFFLKNATPPAALVGGLKTDGAHAIVERDMSTNIKGLFAAGDITGRPYQYAKAAGEGLVAAYSVHAYLSKIQKT